MKSYNKRIWVLALGVAVATVIAITLLFNNNYIARQTPEGAKKLTPPSPTQLIKKTLEKIEISRLV